MKHTYRTSGLIYTVNLVWSRTGDARGEFSAARGDAGGGIKGPAVQPADSIKVHVRVKQEFWEHGAV